MSKRSEEAKRQMKLPPKPAAQKRNFTPDEMLELQEMTRLANGRRFEAAQVRGNTALVPRGQQVAEELEAVARLMENAKNLWVAQTLLACGYPHDSKCSINLVTGDITLNDESKDSPEA